MEATIMAVQFVCAGIVWSLALFIISNEAKTRFKKSKAS